MTGIFWACEKDPFPVKGYEIEITAPKMVYLSENDTLKVTAIFRTTDTGLIHNAILRLRDTSNGGRTVKKWGGHVHSKGVHTIKNYAMLEYELAGKTLLLYGEAYSHGEDPYRQLDSVWVSVYP